MKYEFFADAIDLGIDDVEEVYTVSFTETNPSGGPSENYLLLQRSVAGIDDPDMPEPYVELTDPANGRFAGSIASGELLPTYVHLQYKPDARIVPHPLSEQRQDYVTDLVVRFNADGPLLRKMKYALEMVVSDGFGWKSVA